ncbi:hypothetical protein [Gracilimonas mengyeensis]|uniref:Carboxypeptidase regulatory-like domain-containing protein n=1 Tax=Gracilimonas mengyeensis TaxID=1302730 RepID=A0A521AGK6_9BACT|nr:hypothetical protein [Gracilimonas mengyeensis]SMO33878.1 hypothetical protein SAMN06265219_101112 [Gracilimonas mengyeensis]
MNLTKLNFHKLSVFILGLGLLGSACSSDSSSNSDSNSAIIEGSVQQQQAKAVQSDAYVVSAARINSDGSFSIIEGSETEVDASGNFTLTVDAETANNIAVVAENEGQEFKGYLSSEIENGQTYTLKTLNTEYTAESEVYAEVIASGNSDIVQKSDIEAMISSEAAANIESDASAAANIASSLEHAAEARAEFFAVHVENNSQAALETTYEELAEAQVRLEAELEANTNAEARQEAYEVFTQSIVDAYAAAELEASSTAKAIEMWSRVAINSMSDVEADVREDARLHASTITAIALDLAVQAEADEMNDSSQEAIADAGLELQSAIETSNGIQGDIEAAFESYHEDIRSIIESDGVFEAALILEIDSQINGPNGAKADFSGSISSSVSASMINNIYTDFYTSIETTVENIFGSDNEAMVESITEIMILINLNS